LISLILLRRLLQQRVQHKRGLHFMLQCSKTTRLSLAALAAAFWMAPAFAAEEKATGAEAVVFMYHRFGEDKYPATNIRLDQLDAQIAYLKDNGFNVLPLPRIVDALLENKPLPPKTVAITIDDAYASVVTEAHPRFKRAKFPYTLFVAAREVDRNVAGIMSWDDVRALRDDGVTIGAHGYAHEHMPAFSSDGVRADLQAMKDAFTRELGGVPALFAYPYGEAGRPDMEMVKAAGFKVAFGQHSGVLYGEADMFYLPRFALNEHYGTMERFTLIANTKPLRVVDFKPVNPVLPNGKPTIEFAVASPPPDLKNLSCFDPAGEPMPIVVGAARVTVTPAQSFKTGRARMNCTLNSQGQWYWYGHQFIAGGSSEGVPVDNRYR